MKDYVGIAQAIAYSHEHNKNIGGVYKPCPICELRP